MHAHHCQLGSEVGERKLYSIELKYDLHSSIKLCTKLYYPLYLNVHSHMSFYREMCAKTLNFWMADNSVEKDCGEVQSRERFYESPYN